MNEKVRYTNKGLARRAMTILLDRKVVFTTFYEYVSHDEYCIRLDYTDKNGEKRQIWPVDEMMINEIRYSI